MKIIANFLTTIAAWGCFTSVSYSQTVAPIDKKTLAKSYQTIDSLKSELNALRMSIDQKSYTRIPNADFEKILDNKIQGSIQDIVNWWLVIIGILASLLGFLLNKYAKSYVQNIIDEKNNQLAKDNEKMIKSKANQYFSSVIETLIDFKIETITKKKNIVAEAIVNDLKNYLTDETITITENKKVVLIDIIMLCYYCNDYEHKYKKMIDLIKQYEEKFTLLASTYANAAIAFTDRYDKYGSKDFLVSALENCNKSIKILPDYGLVFAQKLELYTMAMMKAFDEQERKQYESELQKVFNEIKNNKSIYLCDELIKRFTADENTFMKPYLTELEKNFPSEMEGIRSRVPQAATTNDPGKV